MENTINEKRSTDLNSDESVCTYAATIPAIGQYVERMGFIRGLKVMNLDEMRPLFAPVSESFFTLIKRKSFVILH